MTRVKRQMDAWVPSVHPTLRAIEKGLAELRDSGVPQRARIEMLVDRDPDTEELATQLVATWREY